MKKSLTNDLQRCFASDMSDKYISHFLQIDVQLVADARSGKFPFDEPKKQRMPQRSRAKLVPVSRPFPKLTDTMTDGDRIIALTRHGLSASKIQKFLTRPASTKSINQHATKVLGPPKKGNNSVENWLDPTIRVYVVECMSRLGKNPYQCELFLDHVSKGCQIHHTKYAGATVYDLMYICSSCNLSRENKGLE
ncbi:hypothetical protein [Rhodococcus erythropolis]|uniref:Uncharacterized protein n=1 Tax=Rhodococcus erythropolis (strain PR4 / NBRC 100887) TaxID=234621 RepID=C0ZXV7_RHOE4|nr:hypothetical protein [Rhodococcus erythropolis]BAH33192.1 hypothetical protein RER_24840 [Rhodococcus erythropolis PR4]